MPVCPHRPFQPEFDCKIPARRCYDCPHRHLAYPFTTPSQMARDREVLEEFRLAQEQFTGQHVPIDRLGKLPDPPTKCRLNVEQAGFRCDDPGRRCQGCSEWQVLRRLSRDEAHDRGIRATVGEDSTATTDQELARELGTPVHEASYQTAIAAAWREELQILRRQFDEEIAALRNHMDALWEPEWMLRISRNLDNDGKRIRQLEGDRDSLRLSDRLATVENKLDELSRDSEKDILRIWQRLTELEQPDPGRSIASGQVPELVAAKQPDDDL